MQTTSDLLEGTARAGTGAAAGGGADGGARVHRCRSNSRHGQIDPRNRSYPPVEAVCRALRVLRTLNRLRIAGVNAIYEETGIPKPTIVRMLETLMSEGYVARDNMYGGYRVTHKAAELSVGYEGVSRVIEIARPLLVDLANRIKWPVGLGALDDDAITIQFWTGTISPWAHTNTVLGLKPDFQTSAMGRAYMAFCSAEERERRIEALRRDTGRGFCATTEAQFRALLGRIAEQGYAYRDPATMPQRTATLAVPIRHGGQIHALVTVSYFRSALPSKRVQAEVIEPLLAEQMRIETTFGVMTGGSGVGMASGSALVDAEF